MGISCVADNTPWWAEDQPSYVSDPSDPNYGKCVGYTAVPGGVHCSGSYPTTQRLCRCDTPSSSIRTFGTGLAGSEITTEEVWIYSHFVAAGDVGVMTHFWTTYETKTDDGVVIRYYIDGEQSPSIEFTPSLACGVGFYDSTGPWGTQWFGKGANDGAWFNNFRIPFQKSIVVTAQHKYETHPNFYIIVRGATNVPISVGGVTLPTNAKMNLFTTSGIFEPLEWIDIVDIDSGAGVHWMHSLQVASGNMNFLEGCYHGYFNGNTEFPGVLLSTGTEDYFDSAWYFNAGEYHLPVSGFTHLSGNGSVNWSAYRFHEMDPLWFDDGFKFVWRNGDLLDPAGIKCMMESGGSIAGSPTQSNVTAYAWVYTW